MGLTFKPSKCQSLSIQGGKVTDIKFFLLDGNGEKVFLNNMEDDPHKFLGSTITRSNSPADHFSFLKEKLECKLENLNETRVRGEYKIAVYSRYILPSLQFHFSVHNIHKTHLDILDHLARKFLKSWLNFPSRGVTDLGIFHPSILGIKYPSQVYQEAHMNSFISLKLSEDPVVREAVACQLVREGAWVKKSSTAVECQDMFDKLSENNPIPTHDSYDTATRRMDIQRLKKAGKSMVADKYQERASETSIQLVVQGGLASLLVEEKSSMDWQSLIYAVPRGVMAFAARSSTNSLASPDNLARWKKIVHPKCPLCSVSPCTLGHLLSNCQQALNRYEWRHNNIVKYLHSTAHSQGMEAYADLEGCRVNGVTIPANIIITGLKPDLVLINRSSSPQEVTLVELTVPWESSQGLENARVRKDQRYEDLSADIKNNGFKCNSLQLEVGVRGYINPRNKGVLTHIAKLLKIKKIKDLMKKCSKLALLGSFVIWNARHSEDWTSGSYLKP